MGCNCKNKEYHPCQNGGKCQCGGKCKKRNYSNVAGSLDDFKKVMIENNTVKVLLQIIRMFIDIIYALIIIT